MAYLGVRERDDLIFDLDDPSQFAESFGEPPR